MKKLHSPSQSASSSSAWLPLPPPKRCLSSLVLLLLPLLTAPAAGHETVPDQTLRTLAGSVSDTDFDIHSGALLAPILKPRVPGTTGHEEVERHLASFFNSLNGAAPTAAAAAGSDWARWKVEWQNSTATTPADNHEKEVPFKNLIATLNPPGVPAGEVSRLTLVAHYDSKAEPEGFVGATDSAAPCAMLMHVARHAGDALRSSWLAQLGLETPSAADDAGAGDGQPKKDLNKNKGDRTNPSADKIARVGLQIIMLDGEEAFAYWSEEDSLYGARSLAASWEASVHPAGSTHRSPLSSISLFVLLDLLGGPDPSVPSYFPTTHWAYRRLAGLHSRLDALGLLESDPGLAGGGWFPHADAAAAGAARAQIQDDHVPFARRGVEVLHLIPSPFPAVWHTAADSAENLDGRATRDWARLMNAFVADWFGLGRPQLWELPARLTERKESADDEPWWWND